jgi:hypothetical protein
MLDYTVLSMIVHYLFFIMYLGLQEAKPPPCPLLLTKQGGSIQCIVFISHQACYMVLHTYRYHQLYIITLREDI